MSVLLLALACDDGPPKVSRPTDDPPTTSTTPVPVDPAPAEVLQRVIFSDDAVVRVRGLGDTDGDGTDEVLAVTATGTALVVGAGGVVVRLHDVAHAAPGGDADGDGLADLALQVDAAEPFGFALGPFGDDGPAAEAIGLTVPLPPEPYGFRYAIGPVADAMTDLDGDGRSDFAAVLVTPYAYTPWLLLGQTLLPLAELPDGGGLALLSPTEVAFGVGDGVVHVTDTSAGPPQYLFGLPQSASDEPSTLRALGNVDGDGRPDLAGTARQGRTVGAGAMFWTAPGAAALPGLANDGADLAGGFDLDGDGADDVAVSWFDGARFHVGIGLGPWSSFEALDLEVVLANPTLPTGPLAADADFDGDGVPDLALATADGLLVVSGASVLAGAVDAVIPPRHEPVDGCAGADPVPRSLDGSRTPALAGTLTLDDAPLLLAPDDGLVTELTVGNVDGDGALDVLIGASGWLGYDDETSGMLYAVRAPALGTTPLAAVQRVPGLGLDSAFGAWAVAGDHDGDGDDDVFTGDWWLPSSPRGLGCQAVGIPVDGFAGRGATIPDVTGDGVADLATTFDADPLAGRRRAAEIRSSPTPFSGGPRATRTEAGRDFELHGHVAAMGDWDGDGRADVALSADHDWLSDAWVAVVDAGGSGDLAVELAAHATFGHRSEVEGLAGADVDGDGYGDLLVATWDLAGPSPRGTGEVFLLPGGGGGTTDLAAAAIGTWRGVEDGQALGAELAVGDATGDGGSDLLVADATGGAWLFRELGPGSRTTGDADVGFEGGAALGFGGQVALGDLDGDGADEVILSTQEPVAGELPRGGAAVFFGGER